MTDDMTTVWFIWNDGSHTANGRTFAKAPKYYLGTRAQNSDGFPIFCWYDLTYSPFLMECKAIADLLGEHPEFNHSASECVCSAEFEVPTYKLYDLPKLFL